MFKQKCFICGTKDNKDNMQRGEIKYHLFSAKFNYFHTKCLQDVICKPDDYPKDQIERALSCHDFLVSMKRYNLRKLEEQKREDRYLKSRLIIAQDTLECIKKK